VRPFLRNGHVRRPTASSAHDPPALFPAGAHCARPAWTSGARSDRPHSRPDDARAAQSPGFAGRCSGRLRAAADHSVRDKPPWNLGIAERTSLAAHRCRLLSIMVDPGPPMLTAERGLRAIRYSRGIPDPCSSCVIPVPTSNRAAVGFDLISTRSGCSCEKKSSDPSQIEAMNSLVTPDPHGLVDDRRFIHFRQTELPLEWHRIRTAAHGKCRRSSGTGTHQVVNAPAERAG
jgi:hypothetical protein